VAKSIDRRDASIPQQNRVDEPPRSEPLIFAVVHAAEIEAINARRRHFGTKDVAELPEPSGPENDRRSPVMCGPKVYDSVGLALSGGGIRSAAFSLGALQALDATPLEGKIDVDKRTSVLDRVDYLSTVSGGGYIGASMVVGMSEDEGKFPFASRLDQDEPFAVQHIRNYSNYLLPTGVSDGLIAIAIYLRGIAANIILILPAFLFFAAVTIVLNAHIALADGSSPAAALLDVFDLRHFAITAFVAALLAVATLAWALARIRTTASDLSLPWAKIMAGGICVLLFSAFCELQPIVLKALTQAAPRSEAEGGWVQSMNTLSGLLASAAAIISFLGGKVADVIERGSKSATWRAWFAGLAAKLTVWVAAAALPLLLWVFYIYLSLWGLPAPASAGIGRYFGPAWLESVASVMPTDLYQVAILYGLVAVVVFVVGFVCLSPNANSLHQLYRDRLGKAFLFDPRRKADAAADPTPLDAKKLSMIDTRYAPYLLINAALNIHRSKFANRRGRNAEFFLFSPSHVGSEATGYATIKEMEADEPSLDVGTAMAVSGAAASSNMGSASVRPLTPTLALLNVRLGYWMRNPRHAGSSKPYANLYLLNEILSLLNEMSPQVYLTDGGHIENLGIYQLLKRHCGLIIAVDGEADPTMSFNSFVKLQQYARIDLGVRIELPWQGIRDATLATSAVIAERGWTGERCTAVGPHCALGRILYPNGGQGILLYVKASLSGDENDYVVDYKRRYPAYPHETTSDQFFSEEQFEVYRALGFHALKGFLDKKAVAAISMPGLASAPEAAVAKAAPVEAAASDAVAASPPIIAVREHAAVRATREMLGLPDGPSQK
jgi:hypothetical protein